MMLTQFHAEAFHEKVEALPIEEAMKERMRAQVDDFMGTLTELAQ